LKGEELLEGRLEVEENVGVEMMVKGAIWKTIGFKDL
jgi:hypothetical protein